MQAEKGTDFRLLPFVSTEAGARSLLQAVATLMPAGGAVDILDLGCGTGALTRALAAANPGARVGGLDLSPANVAAARRLAPGLSFAEAEYLSDEGGPYDLIVADSVLQWIAGDTPRLARKLASDLKAGGLLVATMPVAGRRNAAMVRLRGLWRRLPPAADALAVRVAGAIYGTVDRAELRARVDYLRILPARLYDDGFHALLREAGLKRVERRDWPGPLMKLHHVLVAYRSSGASRSG